MVFRLFSRVSYGSEVSTGDECNLITVTIVIARQQASRLFVLRARVVQRKPTNRPCHPARGAPTLERLPSRTNAPGTIVRRFVFSNRPRRRHFNLIHPHDRNMCQIPPAQRARRGNFAQRPVRARGNCKRSGCTGRDAQKFSSVPVLFQSDALAPFLIVLPGPDPTRIF